MIALEWRLLETGHCVHPELSSRRGGSLSPCQFPALVALLRHPTAGWMLFDTGYGQAFADATRSLPESLYRLVTPVHWRPEQSAAAQLARLGVPPADVAHVFVSHFHGDHVGGLADFARSRIWCARDAWRDLRGRSRLSALRAGLLPALVPASVETRLGFYEDRPEVALPAELSPFTVARDVLNDGSVFAVSLPGHAAGHFGIAFQGGSGWVLLIGDAAWSTRAVQLNEPPPAWSTALLGDTRRYSATLERLHTLAGRAGDVLVVPAHCRTFRP
jgi:glyoxylase-like metal-dependent hydrolase (beta-lactamase superfamily II)